MSLYGSFLDPYLDILVDGVKQKRKAYWITKGNDFGQLYLKPILEENERLLETMDGQMEIITYKTI